MNPTGFKMTPWFYWRDFLCVFIFVIFFPLRAIWTEGFLSFICVVWNVNVMALPCYWWDNEILWFLDTFLVKVVIQPHWSLPQPHLKHTVCPSCILFATPILAPWGRCRAKGNLLPLAVELTRVGAGKEFTLLGPQSLFSAGRAWREKPPGLIYR